MTGMGPTYEAIAHFVHGGVTVFFIMWTWLLWPLRKQSNMMYMLFLNMAYCAFCNLKDMFFLVDGYWESLFWSGVSVTIDLLYVPILLNFLIEVVAPGWVNRRRVLVPMAVQAIFIPLFICFPTREIYDLAMCVAYGGGIVGMAYMWFLASRHGRYIRENYSYTEYIDVGWTVRCGVLLFVCLTLYMIAFTDETWLSGAVFQLICVFTWLYLYSFSRKHQVVEVPDAIFAFPWVKQEKVHGEIMSKELHDMIAVHLDVCMNQSKMYLNPKLSLQDMAAEIGTNRTYLSEYLNTTLNMTFYEYVNEFRVREACRIMDAMTADDRKSMTEIAELAGFNSISTFNRSFRKMKGVTPGQYVSGKSCH